MIDAETGPRPSPGMREWSLIPHPDFGHPDISITVSVVADSGAIGLNYWISGAIDDVRLPLPAPPVRADSLWKHTCLEAFIRPNESEGYLEFNFAPSRAWAMYGFDRYRENMRNLADIAAPRIGPPIHGDYFKLRPTIYPSLSTGADLGLSAVVEARDGTKSYWALTHAPGPPDFHNPDCFIATLPAPAAP